MTRKHFQQIAMALGFQMRQYDAGSTEWSAVHQAASSLAVEFLVINPRFDQARFLEYVMDVAEGRRDLTGKRLSAAASVH